MYVCVCEYVSPYFFVLGDNQLHERGSTGSIALFEELLLFVLYT